MSASVRKPSKTSLAKWALVNLECVHRALAAAAAWPTDEGRFFSPLHPSSRLMHRLRSVLDGQSSLRRIVFPYDVSRPDIALIQLSATPWIEARFPVSGTVHSGYFVSPPVPSLHGGRAGKRSNNFVPSWKAAGMPPGDEYPHRRRVHLFSRLSNRL